MSETPFIDLSAARIWPPWEIVEAIEDELDVDGCRLRRAGFSAREPGGMEVTGSAAEVGGAPRDRAGFELLERASLIDAIRSDRRAWELCTASGSLVGTASGEALFPVGEENERWRFARSNGVAAGRGWVDACERAALELAERDRLLRSWRGEIRPRQVEIPCGWPARPRSYDFTAHAFASEGLWSDGIEVRAVIGWPRTADAPLLRGFGAARSSSEALERALRETLQGLAFLWGEEIPSAPPAPSASPLFHLDWYLLPDTHEVLRRWLAGGHARLLARPSQAVTCSPIAFVNVTSPAAPEGLSVVKAICGDAIPLRFGRGPAALWDHLPSDASVHPIP
ncbi:YcaO-like family protein [Sorangium sp. So ce1128]